MLRNKFVYVGLMATLGCATTLSAGGQAVKLEKSDAPSGCTEVGGVRGDSASADLENAKNEMRNKAAGMGANYVRLEVLNTEHRFASGTAYKCP
jgi:hypothetical protein